MWQPLFGLIEGDKGHGIHVSGLLQEVFNNSQIKVTCDKVAQPVAVRYCFRDFQPGNVANLRELPLYPFRTDNWE